MQTTSELSFILDKLAHDTLFRQQLMADPVAALARMGITLDPNEVPDQRSLPSQADIIADKDELVRSLETTASMWPFLLSGALVPA